jgi:hypothetical protein
VWDIDGDEHVGLLILEADQGQDDGGEVGRRASRRLGVVIFRRRLAWGLRRDERVGRRSLAVVGGEWVVSLKSWVTLGNQVTDGRRDLREVGELGLGGVPDLDGVDVLADQVFEVGCQGTAVALKGVLPGGFHALHNVEDDGGEAIFVDVDFLVVRDLANRAGGNNIMSVVGVCANGAVGAWCSPHVGEVLWQVADDGAAVEVCSFVSGHGRNGVWGLDRTRW